MDRLLQDGDNDPEIQQLRDRLKKIKKERTLLELQNEIAREEQLLANAKDRLHATLSQTPTVETPRVGPEPQTPSPPSESESIGQEPETIEESVRGIKRSHSESPNVLEDVENTRNEAESVPDLIQNIPVYTGATYQEYGTFIQLLEDHLMRYTEPYATSEIGKSYRHLSEDIYPKWVERTKELGEERITWTEYKKFLEKQVKEAKGPCAWAKKLDFTSSQWPGQSFWEFASFLASQESRIGRRVSETERIKNLWRGVRGEIRALAQDYVAPDNDIYAVHHAFLQDIESILPGRITSHQNRNLVKRRRDVG